MKLKRLLLLCCVGIFLPSVFLIYLGFGSLAAEKRLHETEVAERLGSSANDWMTQIDAELQSAMAAQKGWQSSAVMDGQGRWIEPFHQSVEFSWPALPARRAARLATIEDIEDVDKDYLKAADAYDLLAWDLESPPWAAALLLRAAGCWRKAQAWPQAEESLQHIGRRYFDVRNDHGVPFGLLAAMELGEISAASGHMDRAIERTLDALANLERHLWLLSWKNEKYVSQRLHGHLREWAPRMTEAQKTRWQALAKTLNARAERVERLETWQAKEWPRVQAILREGNRMDQPTLVWPEGNEDLALWINPEIDADSGQRARTQVAWCSRATIEELWHHSARGTSDQAGFTAQIQPVSKGRADGVKRRLSSTVPPMELHIRATGSHADAYLSTRKIIYGTVILMAGVIFLVALRVSWRSLEREMEVSWLKMRYVDHVAPKIKTPLSLIEYIAQKIRRKDYKNAREAAEYYALLRQDLLRLKRVVDDVLDFSNFMDERIPYPFKRFDWAPSLRQTIEGFRESSLGFGVAIDYTASLPVCLIEGHEESLSRAVVNVLENAVLYSPKDRLDIRVVLRGEGDHAVLDIIDQGDGISKSEQALVFDRFYRGASAQAGSITGAGLGLTVARYIIQTHQGTLSLQSTLTKGSTFTIRLPLFPIQ